MGELLGPDWLLTCDGGSSRLSVWLADPGTDLHDRSSDEREDTPGRWSHVGDGRGG